MARKPQTKKIKITSKGIVNTSRGRCRSPIMAPYVENVDVIMRMLVRDKAKIVEVFPDGKEVELTIYNFSQDNTPKVEDKTNVKPVHVGDPAIVNAGTPKEVIKPEPVATEIVVTDPVVEPVSAIKPETTNERPLTRKERRELERKQRAEAATKAESEPVVESNDESPTDTPVEEGSSIITEDAISE